MTQVEPFRVAPFLGALHAQLDARHVALAARRCQERARPGPAVASALGPLGRACATVQASALSGAAMALRWLPPGGIDELLGSTVQAAQSVPTQDPLVRRGHMPAAGTHSFGVVGTLGMIATDVSSAAVGLLAAPLGLRASASHYAAQLGRAVSGCICAVSAAFGLAFKAVVGALGGALGAAWGLLAATVGGLFMHRAPRPLAAAVPQLDESRAWQAQKALTAAVEPGTAAMEARRTLGREALASVVARGDWNVRSATATWTPALKHVEQQKAAIAELCGGAGAVEAARMARYAHHVATVAHPRTLLALLEGNALDVGVVPRPGDVGRVLPLLLDFPALLGAGPKIDTFLRHDPAAQAPTIVVDTLLQWPPGRAVRGADGTATVLTDGLLMTLTVAVVRPSSATTTALLAQVREAQMLVGETGAVRLTTPAPGDGLGQASGYPVDAAVTEGVRPKLAHAAVAPPPGAAAFAAMGARSRPAA